MRYSCTAQDANTRDLARSGHCAPVQKLRGRSGHYVVKKIFYGSPRWGDAKGELKMAKKLKLIVLPFKLDLDAISTAIAALIVYPGTPLATANTATPEGKAQLAEWLADSEVVCIEVGGSGQTDLNNFDHHQPGLELACALAQFVAKNGGISAWRRLAEYIDAFDSHGPSAVKNLTVANIEKGLRLQAEDQKWPTEKLLAEAKKLLDAVLDLGGEADNAEVVAKIAAIVEFAPALARVTEEDRLIADLKAGIQTVVLSSGKRLGVVTSPYRGNAAAIVTAEGFDFAAAFNPLSQGGKWTFAVSPAHMSGNLNAFFLEIKKIEPEAGGRDKVGGSAKESKLTATQIVAIAEETLA